ncbi:hypothetical protein QSJ19_01160 [Gordonia sp. ABSL11-1]|uniref:hypothetical protein n=1 Tax=Gordonia sp. ABSL11-1 TaxID=3053924 RepID=UPI0025736A4A|nr:hypothetical protein [Gordonia sp. ABSL11-1]MDL9944211.1 hypothetical protein [Gordonia sp. ABSL11-1]
MTGTVRYFDVDHRGYEQPREVHGEILADSSKFVTVDTPTSTVLVPVENTIHIAIDKEHTS